LARADSGFEPSALGLEGEAAQVLLVGVEGASAPSLEDLGLLQRMGVGGVLLFGFNIPSEPKGLGPFVETLQDAEARGAASRAEPAIPLIVALDHEGGEVFRFKGEGITRLPPPAEVGARGEGYAALLGHAAGAELRALGINMALAPVVELLDERNEAFIGGRSYGRDPAAVDACAGAFIQGLQAEGVASVAKHFPGDAGSDPHKVLPVMDIGEDVYERDCLPRFASAIAKGVSTVMLSHIVFQALDPGRPASLSPFFIEGQLKGRLGFRGLALTDDLDMRALTEGSSPERSAVAALAAGADLLMLSEPREAMRVRDAIILALSEGRLSKARLEDAVARILELKRRFAMGEGQDPAARSRRLEAFPSIVAADAARIRDYLADKP
jgi:beta-N-acetylhexosaminidase